MEPGDSIPLIGSWLRILYVRNTGTAFSMFAGNKMVTVVFTSVLIVSEVLAEAVKHADLHIRMVDGILKQAVERIFHQLIVPVHGQESDADPALFLGHTMFPLR